MDLKEEGEKLGKEVYERIARDYSELDYFDFKTLVAHLYAGIFDEVYNETYRKKRGSEYWSG